MNKVYLITGGGHFPGIGSVLAVRLLEAGHSVAVVSRSFDTIWNQYQQSFTNNLLTISADISKTQSQDYVIDQILSRWGQIDGLVNNAASTERPIYDTNGLLDRDIWEANNLLNIVVPYELSMKCISYLEKNNGNIVNIGSRAGIQTGCGNNFAYSTSKAAMHHLTKEMAQKYAPVRVNCIAPGLIITQRLSKVYTTNTSARLNQWLETSLLHKEITADDVAETAIYLLNAKNVTGQIINVCGGVTIQPPVINLPPA